MDVRGGEEDCGIRGKQEAEMLVCCVSYTQTQRPPSVMSTMQCR